MRKIEFTPQQTHDIIHKYQYEHLSQQKIAEYYNVSKTAIRNLLLANNVQMRNNKMEIPDTIKQQIIDRYVNQYFGLQTAGKPWGYSQKVVETLLKDAGIHKRTYLEAKQIARAYSVNDDYFKTQSSNMAYILGFLATDGNIAKKENRINIQLQLQDEQILQDIKNEVQSTYNLDYYKTRAGCDTVKFNIWSYEWKKDLAIYNIIPNKTFVLMPPDRLNKIYYKDFIRGYFDGDGSISCYKNNIKHCSWEIVGASKSMIEWIYNILANQYHIFNTNKITKFYTDNDKLIYKIGYYRVEDIQKLYNLLYQDDDCLCLLRKKEKFETILK